MSIQFFAIRMQCDWKSWTVLVPRKRERNCSFWVVS